MSRPRLARPILVPCLLASYLVLACDSAREAETRESAGRVARAIEVLRNAPNEMKAGPLAELGLLACLGAEVCQVRDACHSAYQRHVDALALTASAKQQVKERDNHGAGKLLVSAESALSEASGLVLGCVEREGALRHRYKL